MDGAVMTTAALAAANSYLWLCAQLARHRYKPGFRMEIRGGADMGALRGDHAEAYLQGSFRAPDSRTTTDDHMGRTIRLQFLVPIPDYARESEDDFTRWLRWTLRDIELHESDEWLRRDGVIMFDPHAAVVPKVTTTTGVGR